MRNVSDAGNPRFRYAEPPLGYTNFISICNQKKKQRALMEKMQINKYLSESDSDFDDHKSITPKHIESYKEQWDNDMRKYQNKHDLYGSKTTNQNNEYEYVNSRYLDEYYNRK